MNNLSHFLNGVDTKKFYQSQELGNHFRRKFKLEEKLIIGYVGTLGMSHSLDTIIEVSEKFSGNDNIHFIFVGDGSKRKDLAVSIHNRSLKNVSIIPPQTKDYMPSVWNACDIALVTLKDSPVFKSVIPSKIFECMATGTPMILSMPAGEATEIITKNVTGVSCLAENEAMLYDKIKLLIEDHCLRNQFSKNGLKVSKLYERKKMADKMYTIIEKLNDN